MNPSNYDGAVWELAEMPFSTLDSEKAPSANEGAWALDVSELLDSEFAHFKEQSKSKIIDFKN